MAITDVERNIREAVKEQLAWDNRVRAANIDVYADEGKVTLNGDVPTSFSRLAAEEDAWAVIGVTEVINNLEIRHPESYQPPQDVEIKKAVEGMLQLDHRLDSADIIAEVNGAAVTLNGTVDAFWKKSIAEEYAHRAAGVVDVNNRIKILPDEVHHDETIARQIRNALERNSITSRSPINVDVENGEVTLSGEVVSALERNTARDVAYFTAGVKEVKNQLKLTFTYADNR